jgi:hypothetical protein
MVPHQYNSALDHRKSIVAAYSQLIAEKQQEGRIAYFLNFMFNQLPGSQPTWMKIMEDEVQRVHSILTHHIVRRPDTASWVHLRPIFIGGLDYPVFKRNREKLNRFHIANDGLHLNVVALVPPESYSFLSHSVQCKAWGPRSRLTVPLDQHFKDRSQFYLNDRLARIHATLVDEGTMAEYALKAFKRGRAGTDSMLILN